MTKQWLPYTYLIGWSKLDRWYYGCQYGNSKYRLAHPDNLWSIYHTSSRDVARYRELYGEPDVIEIRRTFISKEKCVLWERAVLNFFNVANNERWLNRHNGSGTVSKYGPGKKWSAKTREKIMATFTPERRAKASEYAKTRMFSEEHKKNMSIALTGRKMPPEAVEKTRQANIGKKLSPEHVAFIIAMHTGSKRTEETKAKISANSKSNWENPQYRDKMVNRGSKKWLVTIPSGEIIEVQNLKNFCRENDISYRKIGEREMADKGYTAQKYLNEK